MDTDSSYLAFAGEILYGCVLPGKAQEKQILRIDCREDFVADAKDNFSHVHDALFKNA